MTQAAMHSEKLQPLAYRLRRTVSMHRTPKAVVLTLSYPLKAIRIHLRWDCLFKQFSHKAFVSFETIRSFTENQNPEALEFFLNGLVRKGFLERQGLSPLSDYPFVSVIIPVRNRPDDIAACLQSLGGLAYPHDKLEIIVVDDASTDHTPDVASRFPVRLIRLTQHKQAAYCRNVAAQRCRGDLLAFLDSDCQVDPLWLQELVPAFKDQTLGAVGGTVECYFNKNGLDRYEMVKSSLNVSSRFRRSALNDPFFYLPACNLMVRRDVFLKTGGFREALFVGEDVDFCWRMKDGGYHFEYRPQGRVFHKHRNKVISFCRRRFEYGTSEPLLNRLHPAKIKQMLCPPLAFCFWAGTLLALVFKLLPLLGVSGAALMADAAGKRFQVRKMGIPIQTASLFLAVLRGYAAFLYHICSFVSRYYLFLALVILPIAPAASMVILILHLFAGTADYVIAAPPLNPISFLFYFTLEQLSYQLGVWWGCFKTGCFRPVYPMVVSKISA